jgi:SAM-dependent methyltransferase
MTISLPRPYDDLVFMTPLAEPRADALVRFLTPGLTGTVLDIGCGWGELLMRVVAAAPEAQGLGIDLDAGSIDHGRRLAGERGLTDRVTLVCGDAAAEAPEHVEAVICIGASQVWGPPVQDNKPVDYASALAAIRAKVGRGARVVYGEGVWSRPPTTEAVAPLAGRLDELVALPDLVELAVAAGLMPVAVHEANVDEWDEFESGYSACYASWLAVHGPDHPEAGEVRARAERQRVGYLRGYRGILWMAYLALLAV